jgi:hypothetical protein
LGAGSFDSSEIGTSDARWDIPAGSLYMHSQRIIVPPASPFKRWELGFGSGGGNLRGSSYIYDIRGERLAGYDYRLEQVENGQIRLSLSPMPLAKLKQRMGPHKVDGHFTTPPGLPTTRTVRIGEPFEVTLWESGGERIYERIVFSWTAPPTFHLPRNAPLQEGGMRLAGPQLYVNAQLAASQASGGYGPVIWVHLPGQGRFLVALDPQGNSRFAKAGHVSGNTIEFQSGGIQFRIVCTEPITTGGDRPVFVYHQQSFENMLDPSHPLTGQAFLGNAGPANLFQE